MPSLSASAQPARATSRLSHIFVMKKAAPICRVRLASLSWLKEAGAAAPSAWRIFSNQCTRMISRRLCTPRDRPANRKASCARRITCSRNITNGGEIIVSRPDDLFVIVLSLNHLLGRFGFLKSAVTGRTNGHHQSDGDGSRLESHRVSGGHRDGDGAASHATDLERPARSGGQPSALGNDREARFGKIAPTASAPPTAKVRCPRERTEKDRAPSARRPHQVFSYSGAAMPPRIMRFFELIGIPLIGAYGSTECGGVTLCGIGENRPGNLGKPFPNVEVRIAADTEILVRAPRFAGYFENPEATRRFSTRTAGTTRATWAPLTPTARSDHRPEKRTFFIARTDRAFTAFIELQLETSVYPSCGLARRPSALYPALLVPERGASPSLSDSRIRPDRPRRRDPRCQSRSSSSTRGWSTTRKFISLSS